MAPADKLCQDCGGRGWAAPAPAKTSGDVNMVWLKTILMGVGLGLLMGLLLTGLEGLAGEPRLDGVRFLTAICGGVAGAVFGRLSCHRRIKELRRELDERLGRKVSE